MGSAPAAVGSTGAQAQWFVPPKWSSGHGKPAQSCESCQWRESCLPGGPSPDIVRRIMDDVRFRCSVKAGEYLFHADDRPEALYAIFTGQVKEVTVASPGRERVVGFPMAGELCGTSALSGTRSRTSAVALEDTEACAIPVGRLVALSREYPALQRRLHALLSDEIARGQRHMLVLGGYGAEARVTAFFLDMAQRYARRGYSASSFHMRMTRAELGSYLGLQMETVSRVFARLRAQGIVAVRRREVSILNLPTPSGERCGVAPARGSRRNGGKPSLKEKHS